MFRHQSIQRTTHIHKIDTYTHIVVNVIYYVGNTVTKLVKAQRIDSISGIKLKFIIQAGS